MVHLGEPGATCHVRLSSTQNRSSLALFWCITEVSGMTESRETSFFYMSVEEKHPVAMPWSRLEEVERALEDIAPLS